MQTLQAIQSARAALRDDYKLVGEASDLFQQLTAVTQYPAQVEVQNPNIR